MAEEPSSDAPLKYHLKGKGPARETPVAAKGGGTIPKQSSTPAAAATRRLDPLLKSVSRSFHLTLRVLPAAIRPQIGLAYLLARATDTVAEPLVAVDVGPLEARYRDLVAAN